MHCNLMEIHWNIICLSWECVVRPVDLLCKAPISTSARPSSVLLLLLRRVGMNQNEGGMRVGTLPFASPVSQTNMPKQLPVGRPLPPWPPGYLYPRAVTVSPQGIPHTPWLFDSLCTECQHATEAVLAEGSRARFLQRESSQSIQDHEFWFFISNFTFLCACLCVRDWLND